MERVVGRFEFHIELEKMTQKKILIWAIALITVAIILGAFGAHALKEVLSEERLLSFETGVKYQMYHGLALLAIAALSDKWKFNFILPILLLIIGTLLFSGSIYGLAMQEVLQMNLKFLGPITPIGGFVLIVGWVFLGIRIART